MATTEERLQALERDVSRLLERVSEAATVDTAEDYREVHEATWEDLLTRVLRVERALQALEEKHKAVEKEGLPT